MRQTEADIEASKRIHNAIGTYYKWKYEADKDLVKRIAFKWSILRPGGLSDSPGQGTATIGRTPMSPAIAVSPFALQHCHYSDES